MEFSDIVTKDESEFLQHYDHERMWRVSAEEVPTRVRPTIAASKTMLTVFLSGRGAIFLNWLRSRGKVNSNYFCQHILRSLAQILHSGRNTRSPRPIVHFNNATPHRLPATDLFLKAADSLMSLKLHTALISVYATSFSSAT
jgi:hypothetical protein